jgi:hypothetical protein
VALMRQRGGLIDAADLRAYRAQLVLPLAIRFRETLVDVLGEAQQAECWHRDAEEMRSNR